MTIRRWIYFLIFMVNLVVIDTAIVKGIQIGYPKAFFEEGFFATWFSVYQIFLLAVLACAVFALRVDRSIIRFWKAGSLFWLFMALGAAAMAYDEGWQMHEWIKRLIHQWLEVKKTALSDRLDIVILGGCGVLALVLIYFYRKEFIKFREAYPLFFMGFFIFFFMIAVDAFNERKDLCKYFFKDPAIYRPLNMWLCVVEESLKLVAEGFFAAAFTACVDIAWKLKKPAGSAKKASV